MNIMQRIRIYHATLAILAILAYLTGEMGLVHAWLGYSVSLVIILRLLWALSGHRQVGLMRFYPSFEGLQVTNLLTNPSISKIFMLGIALSLLAVTGTGIAIDQGRAIGIAPAVVVSVQAVEAAEPRKHKQESLLTESHELFSSMLILFVSLHVAYIVLFKLPLAKFMLFIPRPLTRGRKDTTT